MVALLHSNRSAQACNSDRAASVCVPKTTSVKRASPARSGSIATWRGHAIRPACAHAPRHDRANRAKRMNGRFLATCVITGWLAALAGPDDGRAQNGPYQHQIHSATSADGLTWTRDGGVRLDHASVPCALAESDRIFLYYVDADRGPGLPESAGCAVSSNGLDFVKQPFVINGLPTYKALDPSILKDGTGTFRLYYFGSNAGGAPGAATNNHEIHLATSFDDADGVVVSQVAKLEQLKPEERLNPEQLMKDIAATGKPTAYLADVDAIVEHIAKNVQGGDVVCVFSNGGFGNIHAKLLERLKGRK